MPQESIYKIKCIFGIDMEVFSNFKITYSSGCVVLEADYTINEISADDTDFVIGTPKCWDDTLSKRIPWKKYTNYHLFSYTLNKSLVNRISDHKSVWGLANLSRGVYSTYSDTNETRTYIGIDVSFEKDVFNHKKSSVVILVPQEVTITAEEIVSMFCKPLSNFFVSPSVSFMLEIQRSIPGSIMLFYHFHRNAQLAVVGNDVEKIFSKDDCAAWECSNTSPCHHWM